MQFSTQTLLAFAAMVSTTYAQTWSECNVMDGDECKPNKALGTSFTHDYTKSGESKMFTATGSKDKITYGPEGMTMMVSAELDAPTLTSNWYIFFGRVDFVMKAAPGGGVISSGVLQSDTLDEIDWEWVGSKTEEVQSNYFGKGNTTTYDRGGHHPDPGAMTTFKKYSVDWTKERVQWLINDKVIRELKYAEANGGLNYPQTPCQVKLGAWDAGHPKQKEGTLEWAGGRTDYSKKHPMVVQSITVTDYSKGAKSYSYSDKSGSMASIKIDTTGAAADTDEDTESTTTTTTSSGSKATGSSNATNDDEEPAVPTGASLLEDAEEKIDASSTAAAAPSPSAEAAESSAGALKVFGSMAVSFFAAAVVFAL